MPPFKIGALPSPFKDLPLYERFEKVKAVGVEGVQLPVARNDRWLNILDPAQRKEIKAFLGDIGLEISALMGRPNVSPIDPETISEYVEQGRLLMDIALEMDVNAISTHVPPVPAQGPSHPRYGLLQEALGPLAEYGEEVGAFFCIETGPETCATLEGFLESLGARGVAVNLDPANLVMCAGDDPVAGVRLLGDRIVHTHAKDGVQLQNVGPEAIYLPPPDKPKVKAMGLYFQETPLGQGGVDFPEYLRALRDVGYSGYLTLEREAGDDPEGDMRRAVEFLRETMARL